MKTLSEIFSDAGVFQYGTVDTASISFSREVRKMCEVNTCRQYGKTWACPPGLGTLEECQKKYRVMKRWWCSASAMNWRIPSTTKE